MDLIPVLVARDRSGATADFLLGAVSKDCLSRALKPHIHSDAILCTDGSAAMAAAATKLQVQHQAVNLSSGQRVRGPWHIQNANAYHGRLKGWIAHHVRDTLGHNTIATTSIYVHGEDDARHAAVSKAHRISW